MTRACSRSSCPRPYVWRLTSFSLQIWSSAWPLDQPDEVAALTAALSFVTPFTNAATRLVLARSIQVALPLATMTAGRLTNLYDLMDSAYDAPEIAAKSRALGHVPIVDPNPRRDSKADAEAEARAKRHAGHVLAEDVRFNERSAAERVNGALKDCYGARFVRVRGHDKVLWHLMFGVLAPTVAQLMRFVT